jgi:hypothetical protein
MPTSSIGYHGLNAVGSPDSVLINGDQQIGQPQTAVSLPLPTKARTGGADLDDTDTLVVQFDAAYTDFEGNTIAAFDTLYGLQINVTAGSATASNGTQVFPLPCLFYFESGQTGTMLTADLTITATANDTVVSYIAIGK